MLEKEPKIIIFKVFNNEIVYTQNCCVKIYPGDSVIWKCSNKLKLPFAIHIGWDSPFEKESYQSIDGTPIQATVDIDLPFGRYGGYKYFVAVCKDRKIITDDPELVVRRKK